MMYRMKFHVMRLYTPIASCCPPPCRSLRCAMPRKQLQAGRSRKITVSAASSRIGRLEVRLAASTATDDGDPVHGVRRYRLLGGVWWRNAAEASVNFPENPIQDSHLA